MKLDYDLVIVGRGVTGGVMAALMSQSDLKIGIIEGRDINLDDTDLNKPDPRVFAITRASEHIFRAAGIWDDLAAQSMGHFREMNVWDAHGEGSIHFHSKNLCQPTLGYIIENHRIQNALNNVLKNKKNVELICPEKVNQFIVNSDHAELFLESGKRLKTKLIVAADGANSKIRELANIKNKQHDYQQTAIVCSVKTQLAHEDVARQRFMQTGPLAFLPLAEPNTCSIVWSTTPEQATELIDMEQKAFHQTLEEAFDSTLGSVLQTTQRYSFPLSRAHAKNYVEDRIALIGDAAHRVHPLAGQGANLGILDAATLTEVLLKETGQDIGRRNLLRKYERWRKGENLSIIAAMDAFKYIFGSEKKPVASVRNFGLSTVDSLPFVKNFIMHRAMGLEGDLPKIARSTNAL